MPTMMKKNPNPAPVTSTCGSRKTSAPSVRSRMKQGSITEKITCMIPVSCSRFSTPVLRSIAPPMMRM